MTESNSRNSLYRLIYASSVAPGLDFSIVKSILENSEKNNTRDGLTGALVFEEGFFMQVLEGGREQLTKTFGRILRDERHSQVCLIEFASCLERRFSGWGMRYLGRQEDVFEKVTGSGTFKPKDWTAERCNDFFVRFIALAG